MHALPSALRSLRTAAVVSSALVLPFLVLEIRNALATHGSFPVVLFAVLWVLPLWFVLLGASIVRTLREEGDPRSALRRLLPRIAASVLIAWFWTGLVLDQLPCFLGVPNCD